jgi:hypothetical protein
MGASIEMWLTANGQLRTVNSLWARRKWRGHDYYLPESATVVPVPITVVTAIIAVVISATMVPATVVISTVVAWVSLGGSR